MIARPEHREIKEKAITWFEQGDEQGFRRGIEQGIEQGIDRGRREQARRLIERRFDADDERVAEWIRSWPGEQLDGAFDLIYSAQSLEELLDFKAPSSN